MKGIKKLLCLMLCVCITLPCLGTAVFAAEEMYTFFATDFESEKVGTTPATGGELNQWNSKAASAESYAKVVEANGGKALEFGRVAEASGNGGPRYEKKLPTDGKKVNISFEVKTNGNSFGLYLKDSDTNKKILDMTDTVSGDTPVKFDKDAFTPVTLTLNFSTKTYSIAVNGKTTVDNKAMDAGLDLAETVLRIGTNLAPGQTVQIDNVVMRVNDKSLSSESIEEEAQQKAEEMLGSVSAVIAKQRKTPDSYFALFEYDFESDKAGSGISVGSQSGKWHAKAASDTATLTVIKDGENQVAEFGRPADQSGKGYPRLEQKYSFTRKHIVTVEYDVRTNGQQASLELHDSAKSTKLFTLTDAYSLDSSVKIDAANYVHVYVMLDFTKMTYDVTIGDKKVTSGAEIRSDLNFDEPIGLRFNNGIEPGYYTRLDNVFIGINDEEMASGLNKSIRDMTTTGEGAALRAQLKKTHPRIHIDSFDTLKAQIEADPLKRDWYDSVLRTADTYLKQGHYVYNVQEGGVGDNILATSRYVMHMSYVLSFAYKMTGNAAYKDRLYAEFVNVGNFPGWSIEEFLATAEMCHAFALAYDWLYYDWTDAERKNILDIMTKQGLDYAVENYNGSPTGGTNWVNATHNWNLVCNGSMFIAAIAIADEAPQYADFFFEQAAVSIQKGLSPYAPMGAYPEGAGYWAYGTNYLTYAMSAFEGAFEGGVPQSLSYYNTPGIAQTCDFLVYTNAYTGRFNYGDASDVMGGSPILYWYADRFNKPQYAWYLLNEEATAVYGATDSNWTNVLKMIWYNPAQETGDARFNLDKAYTSEEGFNGAFLRSSWTDENGVYIGLQGGYNRDNHMFLSQGNFLLEANGERWSTMRGSGNYGWSGYFSRGTNTSSRWTYYKTRAEGQNTLVLNSGMDADQEVDSVARLEKFEQADNEAYAILNMTDGYKRFGATSVKRGVRIFDNRSRVLLSDEIRMAAPLSSGYWFMHTDAQVQFLEDKKAVMLTQNGKKLYARIIEGPENAVFSIMAAEPLPTSPNPASQASVKYGQKLAIDLSGHKDIDLTVEFIPLYANSAVPEKDVLNTKLSAWKIEDTSASANTLADNAVALFVDSPKAFDRSCVTYVDTNNAEVKPIVQNGRTLIPVRFVAEKFGARVGWDDATQTVTVNGSGKLVKLVIGSNIMTVNGEETVLDVPAQTINDRTLIPLRALVEALGKTVHWDDRGLIVITEKEASLAPETLTNLVELLGNRVYVNGEEVALGFGKKHYDVYVSAAATEAPVLSATSAYTFAIEASENSVTVGDCVYTFNFVSDPTTYASGDLAIGSVKVSIAGETMEGLDETKYLVPVLITAAAPGNTAPKNALDNDITTQWTLAGEQWLCYDFGEVKNMTHFSVAVMKGAERVYNFKLQTSNDGVTWTDVYTDGKTVMRDDLPTLYAFASPISARYVRYVGAGNTTNNWNSINELRFYENADKAALDARYWETVFNGVATYTYAVGTTKQIAAESLNNAGGAITDGVTYSYASSDESVVSVSKTGVLTAKKSGSAVITVTSVYYGVEKTATIKINVN